MSGFHQLGSNAVKTSSGLQYEDTQVGHGPEASAGELVQVHYRGFLQNGTMFDSSVRRGQPFQFPLGKRQVIAGWDEGVAGMKVGGKRILVIPPHLGYGRQGAGGVIPPNAVLTFEVELLGLQTLPELPKAPAKVLNYQTLSTGLEYAILAPATGREAKLWDTVAVHYTGWLEDGTRFDSSIPRGQALEFTLGQRQVISGWEEGIRGMNVGEKRQLRIPPSLGYGRRGAGNVIPPNATLIFDVELVDIK